MSSKPILGRYLKQIVVALERMVQLCGLLLEYIL